VKFLVAYASLDTGFVVVALTFYQSLAVPPR
jgi:hypothetical protein